MVSVNLQKNEKVYQSGGINKVNTAPLPMLNSIEEVSQTSSPSFKADAYTSTVTVRTELVTDSDKKKYNELSESLNGKYKKKLEYALKTGILLKNDSDDRSSVLDNLYKILKEERFCKYGCRRMG